MPMLTHRNVLLGDTVICQHHQSVPLCPDGLGFESASMSLQFISVQQGESTRMGSHDRRLIRSHVMKGRNVGRSRPSAQQLVPPKRVLVRYDCLGCSEASTARRVHTCACYRQALDMQRPIWDDLAMVSVPYQLDRRLRGLIHECQLIQSLL